MVPIAINESFGEYLAIKLPKPVTVYVPATLGSKSDTVELKSYCPCTITLSFTSAKIE